MDDEIEGLNVSMSDVKLSYDGEFWYLKTPSKTYKLVEVDSNAK